MWVEVRLPEGDTVYRAVRGGRSRQVDGAGTGLAPASMRPAVVEVLVGKLEATGVLVVTAGAAFEP